MVIRHGNQEEFKLYCPEYQTELEALQSRYDSLCKEAKLVFDRISSIFEQIDFVREVKRFKKKKEKKRKEKKRHNNLIKSNFVIFFLFQRKEAFTRDIVC